MMQCYLKKNKLQLKCLTRAGYDFPNTACSKSIILMMQCYLKKNKLQLKCTKNGHTSYFCWSNTDIILETGNKDPV